MRRRSRFLALLVLILLPATARAQVRLEWKLKPGDVFFVEEVTQVRQTLILMGSETRQDLDQTRVLRFTVLKKNEDGGLVLAKKIETIRIPAGSNLPFPHGLVASIVTMFRSRAIRWC